VAPADALPNLAPMPAARGQPNRPIVQLDDCALTRTDLVEFRAHQAPAQQRQHDWQRHDIAERHCAQRQYQPWHRSEIIENSSAAALELKSTLEVVVRVLGRRPPPAESRKTPPLSRGGVFPLLPLGPSPYDRKRRRWRPARRSFDFLIDDLHGSWPRAIGLAVVTYLCDAVLNAS
jgi:hypothetical protein